MNRSSEKNGTRCQMESSRSSTVHRPVGQRNWQGFRLFREGVSCHSAFLSRVSRATSTNLAMVKAYRPRCDWSRRGRRSNKMVPPRFRSLDSWWRTPPRSVTGAIHFRSPRRLTNWLFVNLHLKRGGQARIAHRGIDFFPPCLGDERNSNRCG